MCDTSRRYPTKRTTLYYFLDNKRPMGHNAQTISQLFLLIIQNLGNVLLFPFKILTIYFLYSPYNGQDNNVLKTFWRPAMHRYDKLNGFFKNDIYDVYKMSKLELHCNTQLNCRCVDLITTYYLYSSSSLKI